MYCFQSRGAGGVLVHPTVWFSLYRRIHVPTKSQVSLIAFYTYTHYIYTHILYNLHTNNTILWWACLHFVYQVFQVCTIVHFMHVTRHLRTHF